MKGRPANEEKLLSDVIDFIDYAAINTRLNGFFVATNLNGLISRGTVIKNVLLEGGLIEDLGEKKGYRWKGDGRNSEIYAKAWRSKIRQAISDADLKRTEKRKQKAVASKTHPDEPEQLEMKESERTVIDVLEDILYQLKKFNA